MPVTLRPALSQDEPFLYQVYASTRADEMALVPWSEEQKEAFVRMQFHAQTQHYRNYYPDAAWSIVLRDDTPIGRLIVNRAADEILLIDIALLPQYRNQGIGSPLIRDLMQEAAQADTPLRLHVESFNPAQRLYARLGFKQIGESGVYYELEWRAQP